MLKLLQEDVCVSLHDGGNLWSFYYGCNQPPDRVYSGLHVIFVIPDVLVKVKLRELDLITGKFFSLQDRYKIATTQPYRC
jgi:hypothetical protein